MAEKKKRKKRPVTYDKDYARKVAALLLRSDRGAARIAPLIAPEWVEDQIMADVVDVACGYFKKYKKRPTKLVLKKECGKDIVPAGPWSGCGVWTSPTRSTSWTTCPGSAATRRCGRPSSSAPRT